LKELIVLGLSPSKTTDKQVFYLE